MSSGTQIESLSFASHHFLARTWVLNGDYERWLGNLREMECVSDRTCASMLLLKVKRIFTNKEKEM